MHRLSSSFLLLGLLGACTDDGSTEPPLVKSDLARNMAPAASTADVEALVAGNSAFAADVYRFAAGANPGNLFMSPHSISTALAMTYAGANGTTATQIADVFHFTQPAATMHSAQNALDLALASREATAPAGAIPFRLRNANSLWGQDGFAMQTPFLDTLAVNYGAGVHVLDFKTAPEPSRETINGWVEDRTNDRIQNLLPEGSITTATRLVLTNAIYFSAAWDDPFEPGDTQARPFYVNGAPVQVPTLAQTTDARYAQTADYQAVELPYDGGELAMTVVVPAGDLTAFESTLTGGTFSQITDSLTQHSVTLKLPKFKFDSPVGLKNILMELGMVDAFTDGVADLSGIDGTRSLVIGDVLHKGFVAIDEKGTEAAAATAVTIGVTSAPQPATLTVDRPFLFYITDRPTGAVLFVGRVVDPR